MEGIIQKYTEGEAPENVIEIDLEGWTSESISTQEKILLEKYQSIDSLSFSGCGLKHLENFPVFEDLARLDLSNNQIEKGLINLEHLQGIMQISLENNKIADIEEFKHLAGITSLISLMVEGNPIANQTNYREKLFELIPTLQVIDGLNAKGEEVDFGDDDDDDDDDLPDDDDSDEFDEDDLDDDDDDEFGDDSEESEIEEPKPRKKGASDQKGKKK